MRLWLLVGSLVFSGCASQAPVDFALPVEADEQANSAARAWYLKALKAELEGDLEGAERNLGWAVRMNRNNPWIHVSHGRFLERQNRGEAAIAAYKTAVELAGLTEAYEALGRLYFEAGEDSLAIRSLQSAGSEPAYYRLAEYFRKEHDPQRVALVLSAWSDFPSSARWAMERAEFATWAKVKSLFWRDYLHLLEQEPSHRTAELALEAATDAGEQGSVWRWARERQVATRDSRWRAWALQVAQNSKDSGWQEVILRDQLARAEGFEFWSFLRDEGRYLELLESVDAFGHLAPSSLTSFMRGHAFRGLHRYDAAVESWRSVLETDPTDYESTQALVALWLAQGKVSQAVDLAERFVRVMNNHPQSVALLAQTQASAGHRDMAFSLLDALPANQRSIVAVEVALELGELERARALALEVGDVEGLLRVAEWAHRNNRSDEVSEVWEQLQQGDTPPSASMRLFELGKWSFADALVVSPREPALLLHAWEASQDCDSLVYLERGYRAYPAYFASYYSGGLYVVMSTKQLKRPPI